MKSSLTKFCAIITVALLSQISTFAQEVTTKNGRLVFQSEDHYQRVYDQLQQEIANTPAPPEGFDIKEGERYDDYPALDQFEKKMGIQSLRKADLNSEYDQLIRGVEPEQIKHSWFTDAIAASLVNSNFIIQIGNTIYILNSYYECIQIINGDDRLLASILAGENPRGLGDNVKVITRGTSRGPGDPPDPCAGFSANFYPSPTFLNSNSGSFTYAGSPATSYSWNFGDGTTSTQQNPAKTYATSGTYFVTLTVTNAQGCSANFFLPVPVNKLCFARFKSAKGGAPGLYCFTNESTATSAIVSYLWNFGDGTTSTQQNPCHTFPCDKDYTVTLTITTASGCSNTTDKKITVNSYKCCDPDIDESETVARWDYANNRRLKTHANTWDPWIGDDKVSAEIYHYKKVALIWWRSSANLKVEIEGLMFGANGQTGCHCENPFDVACSSQGNSGHRHAWKKLPLNNQAYKTSTFNPWVAKFYKDGNLFRTCVVPANCN
jgi:PKD repeat protein